MGIMQSDQELKAAPSASSDDRNQERVRISVVLCCHNSASCLNETLRHLAAQTISCSLIEVILVDNASTDGTGTTAIDIWNSVGAPFSLRIVAEEQPGLAYARRTGVLEAQGDFILFCDDDNWLSPDYAAVSFDVLSGNAKIGAVGGASHPVFEGQGGVPVWFWGAAPSFAVGAQALRSGDISHRGYLWGAGLVIRGDFLRQVYRSKIEPVLVGRQGSVSLSGDDSEICAWYLLAGYKLYYTEMLRLQHYLPRGRQTVGYFESIVAGHKAANIILSAYMAAIRRRSIWQSLLRPTFNALVSLLKVEGILLCRGGLVRNNIKAIRRLSQKK